MNIAIIPARSGSKRIPNKNIRLFHGKPIISWSINNVLLSRCFDRVIVSTDSEEIASISIKSGAEVPFIRDKKLSDDFTGTLKVVQDALSKLQINKKRIKNVCCVYPTTPLLKPECFKLSLDKLVESKNDFVLSVTKYPHPIQRSLSFDKDHLLKINQPQNKMSRTQDLVDNFYDSGQFCWGTINAWVNNESVLDANTTGYILPNYMSIDIDNLEDWNFAELVFGKNFEKNFF